MLAYQCDQSGRVKQRHGWSDGIDLVCKHTRQTNASQHLGNVNNTNRRRTVGANNVRSMWRTGDGVDRNETIGRFDNHILQRAPVTLIHSQLARVCGWKVGARHERHREAERSVDPCLAFEIPTLTTSVQSGPATITTFRRKLAAFVSSGRRSFGGALRTSHTARDASTLYVSSGTRQRPTWDNPAVGYHRCSGKVNHLPPLFSLRRRV
jgi:hypothetical protein